MPVKLMKCSLPNVWEKEFETMAEAVGELRRHICEECLIGPHMVVGKGGKIVESDFEFEPVDTIHEGVRYACRDARTLLGTACGCEYEMEGDVPWLDDFEAGNAEWAASFAA